MAKRTEKAKAEGSDSLDTPKDGDRILMTFKDHPSSWFGPFIFYERAVDPASGKEVRGACIYSETWQKHGEFAYSFEQIEFWCRWEGETLGAYEERKKKIIADLQQEGLPIDPIDSFMGENSIQGQWSKPRIGPAFRLGPVAVEGGRPKNGELIEVQARGFDTIQRGRYLAAADMIYSEERLIAKRTVRAGQSDFNVTSDMIEAIFDKNIQGPNIETIYSDRFRYGVPHLPFADWIRFRSLDRNPQFE